MRNLTKAVPSYRVLSSFLAPKQYSKEVLWCPCAILTHTVYTHNVNSSYTSLSERTNCTYLELLLQTFEEFVFNGLQMFA